MKNEKPAAHAAMDSFTRLTQAGLWVTPFNCGPLLIASVLKLHRRMVPNQLLMPLLASHRLHQLSVSHDLNYPLHVVRQHMQAHLGSDPFQRSGQKNNRQNNRGQTTVS